MKENTNQEEKYMREVLQWVPFGAFQSNAEGNSVFLTKVRENIAGAGTVKWGPAKVLPAEKNADSEAMPSALLKAVRIKNVQ